jgi:hypothetical protein
MASPERVAPRFQGPPYHLSCLSYTPNENPLPPYDDYCHVLPNTTKASPKRKSKKKHDDDGEPDEEESACGVPRVT